MIGAATGCPWALASAFFLGTYNCRSLYYCVQKSSIADQHNLSDSLTMQRCFISIASPQFRNSKILLLTVTGGLDHGIRSSDQMLFIKFFLINCSRTGCPVPPMLPKREIMNLQTGLPGAHCLNNSHPGMCCMHHRICTPS